MKRLAKSVSATLCASILCSSVLCYNAFMVFAEDTTTAETTASTEASTEVSEDASYKKIAVTDSNDLFTVSEDGEHLIAKKTGYYATCYRDDDGKYYEFGNANADDYSDSYKSILNFISLSEGDILDCTIRDNGVVAFSEDGITSSAVIEYDAVVKDNISLLEPTIDYSFDESNPEFTAGVFTLTANSGVLNSAFLSKQNVETSEFDWFSDIDDFEAGASSTVVKLNFYETGRYRLRVFDSYLSYCDLYFTIDSISGDVDIDNPYADLVPPEVNISMEDKKGLDSGEPFYITVTTNEDCNISVANQVTSNTRKATGYVLENGVYEIVATDKWNNTTTKEITVTAFEDGSTPEERYNKLLNANESGNDNILAVSNRESFWEDAANGKISGVSSSNGSTSLSTLPQTGGFKVACVVLSSGIAIAGGAFVLKKNGFKFKSRKGKGDK